MSAIRDALDRAHRDTNHDALTDYFDQRERHSVKRERLQYAGIRTLEDNLHGYIAYYDPDNPKAWIESDTTEVFG